MSLDDFWYGNPLLFYLYKDAYIEKKRIEDTTSDVIAWQQGLYILSALRQVMSEIGKLRKNKKCKYPEEPFSETKRKEEQTPLWLRIFNKMNSYSNSMSKKFDRK